MKTQSWEQKKQGGGKAGKGLRQAAILVVAFFLISIVSPAAFIFAQNISPAPFFGKSFGVAGQALKQNHAWESDLVTVQPSQFRERTAADLSRHSRTVSKSPSAPASSLNVKSAVNQEESLVPAVTNPVRSQIVTDQPVQSKIRTAVNPQALMASSTALNNKISIPEKLKILAEALQTQNIKGFAALKLDEFLYAYVSAVGVDLDNWIAGIEHEDFFPKIFEIEGPWYLILLPMSPTSMHEYVMDLELPSTAGAILEEHRLPVNLTVEQKKQGIVIELQGSYDLWITFRIDEKNEVSVIEG